MGIINTIGCGVFFLSDGLLRLLRIKLVLSAVVGRVAMYLLVVVGQENRDRSQLAYPPPYSSPPSSDMLRTKDSLSECERRDLKVAVEKLKRRGQRDSVAE